MAKKVNTDFSTTSLRFLSDYILDIQKEVGDKLNVGLEKATDYLADRLIENTPVSVRETEHRGITKQSWIKQMKYRNVKYINNTATNKKGYPIINVLEFSKKRGKPFVRKTLRENEDKIRSIIIAEVEKGGAE